MIFQNWTTPQTNYRINKKKRVVWKAAKKMCKNKNTYQHHANRKIFFSVYFFTLSIVTTCARNDLTLTKYLLSKSNSWDLRMVHIMLCMKDVSIHEYGKHRLWIGWSSSLFVAIYTKLCIRKENDKLVQAAFVHWLEADG